MPPKKRPYVPKTKVSRHIAVLPFARGDRLVLDAVLTVSAFHIWLNRSPTIGFHSPSDITRANLQAPDPNQLYRRVISGLQQQPELESCSAERKHSILITILVLHVGVMVTGRSDFPMLFRMLESALAAMGGCETLGDGEVANFILPEVAKIRLYVAPLLSEESGLAVVSSQEHASRLFNCLTHHLSVYPEHSASFAFITDLVQQAINMYLTSSQLNAPSALDIADSITRVEHFKETLEAFPLGAPGEQVMVWASFVAAASCLLDEHMEFFEHVFMRHYMRSGFSNLVSGLEALRKIWSRKPDERWTLLMAGVHILVIDKAFKALMEKQSANTSGRPRWIVSSEHMANSWDVLVLDSTKPRRKRHRKAVNSTLSSLQRADHILPCLYRDPTKFLFQLVNGEKAVPHEQLLG
ncbi:hypothetical protein CEP51_009158 [Fusarium floridanum]|uniref:Uncharacterized protein n=1 Tax=Fusarium floridanum TaxID=1325733 RepID=A0A428RII1_9HYPO|nr:hypothetical protein CEP51_009158 [Fusarium floridanum]